ncbi:MAG: guanylate kinase, partial [Bacilli bacterium]|nr:guanylate kinase [Bacilli bacterium]
MGKIVVCMGKSSSGKDTIVKELLRKNKYHLQKIVPSTTRPIRFGEVNGQEYYFNTEEEMWRLDREHKIIERRKYDTEHGTWYYYTTNQGIDLEKHNYITMNTLEGLDGYIEHYGRDKIISLLIDLEDGERFQRALDREKKQEEPKYAELCRRFLADSKDFSKENIERRKITKIINNQHGIEQTLEEVNKVLSLY